MKELIEAVKEMRRLQKEYFRSRSQETLRKSKAQEQIVDRLLITLEQQKTPQGTLGI